jgi:hypothetical protein
VAGEAPRTKDALAALNEVTDSRKVLVVLGIEDELNWLSLRNLAHVHLLDAGQLNTYDVLNADAVVFTAAALDEFLGVPAERIEVEIKTVSTKKKSAKDDEDEDEPKGKSKRAKAKSETKAEAEEADEADEADVEDIDDEADVDDEADDADDADADDDETEGEDEK